MKEGKSLKINFIYLVLYKAFIVLVPLIVAPYVSRILGKELIGEYSYWMSLIGYFTLIADFGLDDYGSRMIAKKRDNKEEYSKIFYEIMACRLLLGALLLIIFFSLTFSSVFGENNIVIFTILSLHIIGTSLSSFSLFSGLEKFKEITIRTVIVKLLLVILIFLFVRKKDDFINYIIIYAFVVLSTPLLMIPYLFKLLARPKFFNFNFLIHFKKCFAYFIPILSLTFYSLIDKSMIMWITNNNAENGYFEQASKIISVINNALNALNLLMLSRISYLYEIKAYDEIKSKTTKSFRLLFLLALPCVFGLILVSKDFIPFFFGKEFAEASNLMYFLAPTLLFTAYRNLLQSVYYVPKNKMWANNLFIILGIIINVSLNMVLIKKYGALGAAISMFIADFIVSIIMLIYCRKDITIKMMWETSKLPLASCFFMCEVGLFVILFVLNKFSGGANEKVNFFLIFISCAFTYCFTICFMKEPLVNETLVTFKRKFIKTKSHNNQ